MGVTERIETSDPLADGALGDTHAGRDQRWFPSLTRECEDTGANDNVGALYVPFVARDICGDVIEFGSFGITDWTEMHDHINVPQRVINILRKMEDYYRKLGVTPRVTVRVHRSLVVTGQA